MKCGTSISRCLSGGATVNGSKTTEICQCSGNWKGDFCEIYWWPQNWVSWVVFILQMIGCCIVVILLALVVLACLAALSQHYDSEIILILIADGSMLIAHVFILTCRFPFILDLDVVSCKITALMTQFFALIHLFFLLILSLCNCIEPKTLGKWLLAASMAVGFSLPSLIMVISALLYLDEFPLPHSCIINFQSNLQFCFLIPVASVAIAVLCISELPGWKLAMSPDPINHSKFLSYQKSRQTSLILCFSLIGFTLTALAVFHQSTWLWMISFLINFIFAAAVFFWHGLQNVAIRKGLKGLWILAFVEEKSDPLITSSNA